MNWSWDQCLQSGRPAASGGFVELLVEADPVVVELVLLPVIVLLPVVVLGVSLRTCLVTASQHFPLVVVVVVALGVLVVVEVWAVALPTFQARIATAISPIPVIRMRHPSWWWIKSGEPVAMTSGQRHLAQPVPLAAACCRVSKMGPRPQCA